LVVLDGDSLGDLPRPHGQTLSRHGAAYNSLAIAVHVYGVLLAGHVLLDQKQFAICRDVGAKFFLVGDYARGDSG